MPPVHSEGHTPSIRRESGSETVDGELECVAGSGSVDGVGCQRRFCGVVGCAV